MPKTISRRATLGLGAGLLAMPRLARAQQTEITVHYAQPHIFKEAKEAIAAAFAKREPGVSIKWQTSPDYNEGLQAVLRQSISGTPPDLSYQALNRLRVLTERGMAQDLTPYLARESDLAAQGYAEHILALGKIGEAQAGLAFAASNSICYFNADLMRRAGGDPATPPADWDRMLGLAGRIGALGDGIDPLFFDWSTTEWSWSALFLGHGGRWMNADETRSLFEGPEGIAAMRLFDRIVREGRMPNLTNAGAQQAFSAGKLGMRFASTANLRNMIKAAGDNFTLGTAPMPVIDAQRGRLPVGGSAGVLLAKDEARREAAWKFLRFSTSAEGSALMVKNTGYVPCNQQAVDDPGWLGEFYRENPLYLAATRQLLITVEWYAFPGSNGVRISQAIVDNISRIVERKAAPEQVVADAQGEITRLLPRGG